MSAVVVVFLSCFFILFSTLFSRCYFKTDGYFMWNLDHHAVEIPPHHYQPARNDVLQHPDKIDNIGFCFVSRFLLLRQWLFFVGVSPIPSIYSPHRYIVYLRSTFFCYFLGGFRVSVFLFPLLWALSAHVIHI